MKRARPKSVLAEVFLNEVREETGGITDYSGQMLLSLIRDSYKIENVRLEIDLENKTVVVRVFDKDEKEFFFKPKNNLLPQMKTFLSLQDWEIGFAKRPK